MESPAFVPSLFGAAVHVFRRTPGKGEPVLPLGQLLSLAGVTYIDRLLPEGRTAKHQTPFDPAVMNLGLHLLHRPAKGPVQFVEVRHGHMGKTGEVVGTTSKFRLALGKEYLHEGILPGLVDLHKGAQPQSPQQLLGPQIHHLEDRSEVEQRINGPCDGILQDHRGRPAPKGIQVDGHPFVAAGKAQPIPFQIQRYGILRLHRFREDKEMVHGRFTSFWNQV